MTEIGGVVETEGGGEGDGEGGGAGGGNGLMDAFKTFQTDITGRFERLEGALKPAEKPADDDAEVDELDWRKILGLEDEADDEEKDDAGGDDGDDGQISLDMDQLVTLMKGVAAEAVGPVQQERARERRLGEAEALEQKYPKLADPTFAAAIVSETQNLAQTIAQAVGQPQMAKLLAREPQLAEVVYLAAEAAGAGKDEIPAGQTEGVRTERGGGAAPGDDDEGKDTRGDAIVNAGRARQFRMANR